MTITGTLAGRHDCTFAGWLRFDAIAGSWLGLDESKYEWAAVEKELQDQRDLEAIPNDGAALADAADRLETGMANAAQQNTMQQAPQQPVPMARGGQT